MKRFVSMMMVLSLFATGLMLTSAGLAKAGTRPGTVTPFGYGGGVDPE
jgi:hypothetical protein